MNLYEIDQQLLDLVDPTTGEVLDLEAFEELQMAREKKLDNMALWIKDLRSYAGAIDEEIKGLKARKDAATRKADRLSEYLQELLQGEKRKTARYVISYRKVKSVEISDEHATATWLLAHGHDEALTYPAPKISKTSVKELLEAGEPVKGAEIIERQAMLLK